MKKIVKILGYSIGVLMLLLIGLFFLARKTPTWNTTKGHNTSFKQVENAKYTLYENVKWAAPEGFNLTMDIYTPKGAEARYPVIVLFHGGGWLINDNSIMDQASAYIASTGKYVVCNVNYRLLSDRDNTVKLNEIVEDAMGSILWVKANIAKYHGDSSRIILTGDSAGGHLAAVCTLQGSKINSSGFTKSPDGFKPTWQPKGNSEAQLAANFSSDIKAAIISYGVSDVLRRCLEGWEGKSNIFWYLASSMPRGLFGPEISVQKNPEYYKAVSPYHNIPDTSLVRLPPIMFTVGSDDPLVPPASVQDFSEKLKATGQGPISYWEYQGQSHAFLDGGAGFNEKAVPALDKMLNFLDSIFYK